MYDILALNQMLLPELRQVAKDLGVKKVEALKKQDLVYKILDQQAVVAQDKMDREPRFRHKRTRIPRKLESDTVAEKLPLIDPFIEETEKDIEPLINNDEVINDEEQSPIQEFIQEPESIQELEIALDNKESSVPAFENSEAEIKQEEPVFSDNINNKEGERKPWEKKFDRKFQEKERNYDFDNNIIIKFHILIF